MKRAACSTATRCKENENDLSCPIEWYQDGECAKQQNTVKGKRNKQRIMHFSVAREASVRLSAFLATFIHLFSFCYLFRLFT